MKSKLKEIQDNILDLQLKQSLRDIENVLLTHPSRYHAEAFNSVKSDYHLMADYWLRGFADPQREQVYHQLLRRLYGVVSDMFLTECRDDQSFIKAVHWHAEHTRNDWSPQTIRFELENFVSNVAILELEPEHIRQEKSKQLHADHQKLLNALFCYIISSSQWSESLAKCYEDMMLAPTIDPVDQQLMVSAVMLSLFTAFDFQKFRVLTNVYRQATNKYVRQRALVGWACTIVDKYIQLFPEIADIVAEICQDEQSCNELTELQMQILLCMQAEDDGREIQKEIMPELIKGNNLRITRDGIQEIEEDTLENILHPDAAEQKMELMEEKMQRMIEMQKRGSDIYFGGFSQMKRYSFFNEAANWFMPFTSNHPAISDTWQQTRGRNLLHTLMQIGAFCDSDKYSFVLAYQQVFDRLPKQMVDMIDRGEAEPTIIGGEVAFEDQQKPAYIRRSYLQNLYRFYRLHPQRSGLFCPFGSDTFLFICRPVFHDTHLESHYYEVARFLYKHHLDNASLQLLLIIHEEHYDLNICLLIGHLLLKQKKRGASESAVSYYRQALQLSPQNRQALTGLARAYFATENYSSALDAYQQAVDNMEETEKGYDKLLLNMAVCLINLNRNEEALKILYKLNYEHPDNDNVTRVLAWALTANSKYEQATRLYHKLIKEKQSESDKLNYGYCLWLSGDRMGAASLFRQFMELPDNKEFSIVDELRESEHDFLIGHGISDSEINLMLEELLY